MVRGSFCVAVVIVALYSLIAICQATARNQIAGEYQLVDQFDTSSCPDSVTQTENPVLVPGSPVLGLRHVGMSTSAGNCVGDDGSTDTAGMTRSAYTALMAVDDLESRLESSVDRSDPLLDAMLRSDAIIGTEINQDRVCGTFTVRMGAMFAFFNSEDEQVIDSVPGAEDGRTVMVISESGVDDPQRCVYLAANSSLSANLAEASCFPANARFDTAPVAGADALDTGLSTSARVAAADVVHGTSLSTGDVIAFTHRDLSPTLHEYLQLTATSGATLTVSPGHYVHVLVPSESATKRVLRAAHAVQVGDVLEASSSSAYAYGHVVSNVRVVRRAGRVNPHTASGVVHVDGFAVSCYTSAVHPRLAHAAMRLADSVRNVVPTGVWQRVADHSFSGGMDGAGAVTQWLLRFVPGGDSDHDWK